MSTIQPYPHRYHACASASRSSSRVTVGSAQLPNLETAPPPEFGGPEGVWSPETLLCAALADCFILTFRGVTRAARFDWNSLECHVEGTLERVDRNSEFTRFVTKARLAVPRGTDLERARRLLEQAEHGCLLANSLKGERQLQAEVCVEEQPVLVDTAA